MTKLVIFDLDGVLIDSKDYHYEALNKALGRDYAISREDHINIYDGLSTLEKLKLLTKKKVCPLINMKKYGKISKLILQKFLKSVSPMITS